jgi:hypothetical protein
MAVSCTLPQDTECGFAASLGNLIVGLVSMIGIEGIGGRLALSGPGAWRRRAITRNDAPWRSGRPRVQTPFRSHVEST